MKQLTCSALIHRMSYALTTIGLCFLSVAWCYLISPAGVVTTASPDCLHVCNCSTAAERLTSPVFSVACDMPPACLPVVLDVSTPSVHLSGTVLPVVGGLTCKSTPLPLPPLIALDLSWNAISNLRSWQPVAVSLRSLSVAGNSLRHITTATFAGPARLRSLNVSMNNVGVLDVGCLRHLRRLRTLSLANNSIEHLPRGVFDGLSSLTELRLDNNHLMSLGDGVLAPLTRLTVLTASGNRLKVVDARSFGGGPSTSLRQLDLSGNLLDDLFTSVAPALTVLRHLHSLTLDGNPTEQVRWAGAGRAGWSVSELSISHMPTLIAVHRSALSRFTQLKTLTMTDNRRLRYIDDEALPTRNTLRTIYLHDNNLTSGII